MTHDELADIFQTPDRPRRCRRSPDGRHYWDHDGDVCRLDDDPDRCWYCRKRREDVM